MKKYLSMLSFVFIMGLVSTVILIGTDFITKDRIAKNAEYTWKTAILSHHDITFTDTDFDEVFSNNFNTQSEVYTLNNVEKFLYVHKETGRVSYQFSGGGLWDTISGVITLEDDFKTIVQITVTAQGETPGLGGIVAETPYLENYIGKVFDDELGLVAVKTPPQTDYQVDAITGATGTSNAFVGILAVEHKIMLGLFGDVNPLGQTFKFILRHNNIDYTDENFESLFETNFNTNTIGDLTQFTHKTNGNVSFSFVTGGFNGPISAVVTLDSDYITVVGINVLSQAEGWGAVIQTDPSVLEYFVGKTFDPNFELSEDFDGFGGATTTRSSFVEGLNAARNSYHDTFNLGVNPNMVWQRALLTNNSILSTEDNYQSLFTSTFTLETKDNLTRYVHNQNNHISILFQTDGFGGKIKGVLTLEADFQTIVYITIYEQTENWGARIQNDSEFFDPYVGKKFLPSISFVETPTTDSEIIDGFGGATTTKRELLDILNQTVAAYLQAFGQED